MSRLTLESKLSRVLTKSMENIPSGSSFSGKSSQSFVYARANHASSLGLAAYIYSLDGTTTYTYLAFATSSFGHHSLISTIQVAQSIISTFEILKSHQNVAPNSHSWNLVAVGKPVIAKIADVRSRGSAYVIVREYRLPPFHEGHTRAEQNILHQ